VHRVEMGARWSNLNINLKDVKEHVLSDVRKEPLGKKHKG
jgi:hypothetical protein